MTALHSAFGDVRCSPPLVVSLPRSWHFLTCHFGLRPDVAPRSSGRLWWMRVIFCATPCKASNAIDMLNSLFRYRLSVSIMARLRVAIWSARLQLSQASEPSHSVTGLPARQQSQRLSSHWPCTLRPLERFAAWIVVFSLPFADCNFFRIWWQYPV